jgi:hypothetical protein
MMNYTRLDQTIKHETSSRHEFPETALRMHNEYGDVFYH